MQKKSIAELLRTTEIFRDIPGALTEKIAEKADIIRFGPGDPIIRKGDDGDSMYIIGGGKVKVHDGEHTVAELGEGNFFGEFSLLDAAPRSMSVTAISEVHATTISRESFYNILQSQPEVAKKIIGTLLTRLRRQNDSIIGQLRNREAELTRLVDARTAELRMKNDEITQKNREITDNVNYARRIQSAILPETQVIRKVFPQSFVLYLPKDIVSGDFYFFFATETGAIIAAADCTGHGVTGAFLSVIGNSILTQIIQGKKITAPGEILDQLHAEMVTALNQHSSESADGMDIALCSFELKERSLKYAGANRPLWIVRNGELIAHAPDKLPIGGTQIVHEQKFTTHSIQLEKNDSIYIFTDGYADQFGGELGKKLMTKKLKEILVSFQGQDMHAQRNLLKNYFDEWKGNFEQVDDVLVIGIKV